jgi:hypothetical protein
MKFNENESLGMQCVAEIRRILALKKINASGRTSAALTYEETPGSLTVGFNNSEHAPAFSLQHGSGPHRNSEPKGFVEAILRWVREKPNFTPFNGKRDAKSYDRSAWAIICHIRKYGTQRYGGFTDVWQSVYDDAVVEFRKRYAIWMRQQIKEVLK